MGASLCRVGAKEGFSEEVICEERQGLLRVLRQKGQPGRKALDVQRPTVPSRLEAPWVGGGGLGLSYQTLSF